MRVVLLLTIVALATGWVVVRHLPESEAVADATASVPYEPSMVKSVAIDGRGLPLAAMREAMGTKIGTSIDRERLAADRAMLQRMLETRGFLAAKVDPAVVTYQGNGAYVVFAIERGPEFHVRDVKLVGVDDRDSGMVTIGAWDSANPERIERVRATLENAHQGHVTASIVRDGSASAVDVTFTVTP